MNRTALFGLREIALYSKLVRTLMPNVPRLTLGFFPSLAVFSFLYE